MTGETKLLVDRQALFDSKKPIMEIVYLEDGTPWFTRIGQEPIEVTHGPEFSPFLIDVICQKIVEGGPGSSLSKICKQHGMPSYTSLMRWRRANPWIDEQLDKARFDRAEVLRDEAIDHAMEARDKNDAPAAALKFEAKKWGASLDNPKYSPKSKMDVAITQPTVIQIISGIDRSTPVEPPQRVVQEVVKVDE